MREEEKSRRAPALPPFVGAGWPGACQSLGSGSVKRTLLHASGYIDPTAVGLLVPWEEAWALQLRINPPHVLF